ALRAVPGKKVVVAVVGGAQIPLLVPAAVARVLMDLCAVLEARPRPVQTLSRGPYDEPEVPVVAGRKLEEAVGVVDAGVLEQGVLSGVASGDDVSAQATVPGLH